MSDLWTVRRDFSHVTSQEDARVIGQTLIGDPEFLSAVLRAGAIEQEVPGYGRAVFGIQWNLELLAERYDAIRDQAAPSSSARLDQAVEAACRDGRELAPRRRATFERFTADYLVPGATDQKVPGAVVGAAFAAILPALGPDGTAEEFARSVELMARERFIEPVCLLWDPIEEILNWMRPGHLWQIADGSVPTTQVPAPRMPDNVESARWVSRS